MGHISFTTEEIAKLLRISKLTVYDLIKKGELPAYRVGRQMRVDEADLKAYKARAKGEYNKSAASAPIERTAASPPSQSSVIISGQDISLDILASHLERKSKRYRPLRSHAGSLNGLVSMYLGEAHVASTHLFDGDTGEYNIPYIRRLLIGHRYVVVNMLSRRTGFYVQKGNPKKLSSWGDLGKLGIKLVNREKGSGTRVLLDEQLRLNKLSPERILGYEHEETSHLGVAGIIAKGEADVGIGIEKGALLVGVDFIPLMNERYDVVMLKTPQNSDFITQVCDILRSSAFKKELDALGGYDTALTGNVLFET